MNLDDIGQPDDPDFERDVLPTNAVGHTSAVPALEDVRERLADLRVQPHSVGEHSCRGAMRVDELGDLIAGAEHEGGRSDTSFPRRHSTPHVTDHQPQERQTGHVHAVGVGPEGDVVAEERRKLMGVGMTTDPTDQIGVVHRRPLLRVESHPLGDTGRDQ